MHIPHSSHQCTIPDANADSLVSHTNERQVEVHIKEMRRNGECRLTGPEATTGSRSKNYLMLCRMCFLLAVVLSAKWSAKDVEVALLVQLTAVYILTCLLPHVFCNRHYEAFHN